MGGIPRYSIIPSLALRDARLSARDVTVLCALGEFTNEKGLCWPSVGKIASILGTSRSGVQRSIKKLEECGYITRKHRYEKGKGQRSNLYHVNMNNVPESDHLREYDPLPHNEAPLPHNEAPPASPVGHPLPHQWGTERPHRNDPNEQIPPPHTEVVNTTKGSENETEVGRGGGEFSGEGERELPAPPGSSELERAGRYHDGTDQEGQAGVDALIYPDKLDADEKRLAQKLIETAPADQRQDILDELAGMIESDQIRKSPLSVLRGIVRRAQDGEFAPELALGVQRARKAKKAAEKRRKAAIRASPVQRGAPTTSKEAFRAMKQALGRR